MAECLELALAALEALFPGQLEILSMRDELLHWEIVEREITRYAGAGLI
jgi:hypothetical protein